MDIIDDYKQLRMIETVKQLQQLKAENEKLKAEMIQSNHLYSDRIDALKELIEDLKKERDFLLNQLVVLDGEDVTVQITQEQFEEYQQLKAENEKLKEEIKKLIEINHKLAEEHKTIGQDLYAEIKNYRKENEKLKKELDKIGIEHENYDNVMYWQMKKEQDIYKKCLEEIKEIAKGINCNGCESTDCNRCYDNFRNKINKKISEVLG